MILLHLFCDMSHSLNNSDSDSLLDQTHLIEEVYYQRFRGGLQYIMVHVCMHL